MAKTSRTRNTKELLCPGGPMFDTVDGIFRTAECGECHTRHRLIGHGLIRHVPPKDDPFALTIQHWDTEKKRYV